jgi:hypothetical protein
VEPPQDQDPTPSTEVQLISDGDGLAVIGDPGAIDRFLAGKGLLAKELDLQRLKPALGAAANVAQASSEIAANSGRWVKLTEKSAQQIKQFGLMKSSKTGLDLGIVQAKDGGIKGIVEFAKVPGSMLGNPAMLAGVAGIMAQIAMQQTMEEITNYLAAIDEKVDDVLRAQKDAVLARMIGVGLVIEDAMLKREQVGRVSEVTWSTVQTAPVTIAEAQAYALRQLDALAEKLEGKTKVNDLVKATAEAESKVREWLAVLARCFQLQDAINVLELDRVLDASPDELDRHRLGLKAAQQKRLELISRTTEQLLSRMDEAATRANTKVLTHPTKSPAVVESSRRVAGRVHELHGLLGIETSHQASEARRWGHAAADVRDDALESLTERADAARRLGNRAAERARSASESLSNRIAEQTSRRRTKDDDPGAES